MRVQDYLHGSDPKKIVWTVWTPTGDGKVVRAALRNTPGKLVASTKMPLTEKAADATEVTESKGTLEIPADGSVLYLSFTRE